MAQAVHDENRVTTIIGVDSLSFTTPEKVAVDATTHEMLVKASLNQDVEIGAVEIKDATSDTRAAVGANGLYVDVKATVLPTGASTSAKQDDIITAIEAIPGGGGTQYTEGDTDASITGTATLVEGAANALAVLTQPLTDTQLRASDVKVTLDGESVPVTGTFYQATQPVSLASVPSHDVTNAGTFAVQVDSMPTTTVTATDLDIRPLVNTDVVTAELSAVDNVVLDTIAAKDFATETTLSSISTKIDSLTTPSDTQPVSATSLPLPTGASTSDKQDTIIGHVDGIETLLGTIDADTSTLAGTDFATESKQDTAIAELQKLIGFEIGAYDYIALTYVSAGNGAGEVETATFKTGGSGGTTVATITLAYNASNEISSVTKT